MSEFSVAWGKRGEGGQGREGVQLPDSLMDIKVRDEKMSWNNEKEFL